MPSPQDLPVALRGEFEGFGAVVAAPVLGGGVHIVVYGETLWSICERHYGHVDQDLVHTVAEANPQVTDVDLIRPGWVLTLPQDAPWEATWSAVTVVDGDTLWHIIDRYYGTVDADMVWAVVEANPAIGDPGEIYPGQLITLPPLDSRPQQSPPAPPVVDVVTAPDEPATPPVPALSPAPAETTPSPPPPAQAPTTTTQEPAATPVGPATLPTSTSVTPLPASALNEDDNDEEEHTAPIATVIGWTGGAGLAAAVLGLAARRRRRRPTSQRHQRPSEGAVNLGVAMHTTANVSLVDWAANALRALGSGVRPRPGEPTPVPRLLRLADDQVEIVWDTPNVDLVEPWSTADGGWSWTVNRAAVIEPDDGPAPCPLFVTVGRHGDADVFFNLETCGTLAITGDATGADGLVRSITTELAASLLADAPTVLTIGMPALAADPPNMRPADAAEAIGFLRDRAESAGALLAHRRLTSLFALRARSKPYETHEPVVIVIDTASVDDSDLAALIGLANGDLGAIVLVAGDAPAATWRLDCSPNEVLLQPLGLRLAPVGLGQHLDVAVAEFVPVEDVAADDVGDEDGFDDEIVDVEAVLHDHLVLIDRDHRAEPIAEPVEDASDWDVELKVMGEVRAVGSKEPLSPTELQLAVYLAFHRHGVNADTLATMVWPDGCAKRTVTNTMGSLRRRLGPGPDDKPLYPLARETHYRHRLSSRVVTDWDRFAALAKRAKHLPDDEALPLLDKALELVDGPPFQSNVGYSWAYNDGTAALIAETVKAVGKRSAGIHSSLGSPALALEAAARARRALDD